MKRNYSFQKLISLWVLLLFSSVIVAQNKEVLDNQGVIDLVKSGLPSTIIIKKIQTSPNRFDVSNEALVQLNNSGVGTDIVSAMMEAGGNSVSEYNDLTKKFDQPGIYYLTGEDLYSPNMYMEPSVIDKLKEGSFGSHMAGALTTAAKKKVRAIIANEHANLETTKRPYFLFYFGKDADKKVENQPQANQNDPMAMLKAIQSMSTGERIKFSGINSPNEIRLVKADVDKKERSFIASSASGMVKESGIESEYLREFKFKKLEPGLYQVYFEKPLEPGQYLFVYAGMALYQGQYVYDFSVK
jgi:hypothetical protein